jgi:hypothetical protein
MSAEHDDIEPNDLRLGGWPYEGIVTDVNDPDGVGRVRATVPGVGPTAWCRPISAGGGAARRGAWMIPPVGATVLVWFVQGSPERPVYLGGYWGSAVPGAADDGSTGTEAPERVRDIPPAERPSVAVVETKDWAIIADSRARERADDGTPVAEVESTLLVTHKPTGTRLEIDGASRSISLLADTIYLKAEGQVIIDGLTVSIAERPVRPAAGAI